MRCRDGRSFFSPRQSDGRKHSKDRQWSQKLCSTGDHRKCVHGDGVIPLDLEVYRGRTRVMSSVPKSHFWGA